MICELTLRQKWLYRAIRNKISIEDLVQTSTATSASSSATSNLMNIVMQFRKVRRNLRTEICTTFEPKVVQTNSETFTRACKETGSYILLNMGA